MVKAMVKAALRTDSFRLAHTEMLPIRWGDMDAMMHVNNTVYFRYMEQARIGWMEKWASERGDETGAGSAAVSGGAAEGAVIATASCHFKRPLKYPGTVEVKLFAGRVGRSSLPTYYELRRTDDPEAVCATGEALFVWISNKTGKPVSFPDAVRKRLA